MVERSSALFAYANLGESPYSKVLNIWTKFESLAALHGTHTHAHAHMCKHTYTQTLACILCCQSGLFVALNMVQGYTLLMGSPPNKLYAVINIFLSQS